MTNHPRASANEYFDRALLHLSRGVDTLECLAGQLSDSRTVGKVMDRIAGLRTSIETLSSDPERLKKQESVAALLRQYGQLYGDFIAKMQ